MLVQNMSAQNMAEYKMHTGAPYGRTNRLLLSISVGIFLAAAINVFVFYSPAAVSAYQNPALDRGRERMSHGDYDGAVNALGEALGMNDKDATAYVLRGECFFKLTNYKLAIQDLNSAIQYAPNSVRAYLIRGSCHASLGEDDSAIADYEGAIKEDPSLARKYFRGGGANVGAGGGNANTAGGGGANVGANAGNGPNGRNGGNRRRGRLVTQNGQTMIVEEPGGNSAGLNLHAINDYKQAMRLVYPHGLRGGVDGGGLTSDSSDGNASDRDDTQAASSNSGQGSGSGAVGNGGRRRRRQGGDQAFANSGGAVGGSLDPKQTDAQNNAGIEQDTSIPSKNKRFVRHLDQDPNRAVFGIIAGAGEFQGNAKEAVTDFTESIRNNPNDPATYYQRAKALQKLGRVDDALKDYNQAIERDPQKSQYYVGRASVFYQLGKPLLSEEELTRARAVDPDVPGVVHFALPKYPPSVKWGGGDGPGGH
jgi:tetratricopeptide (TPR) repeat protein